MYPWALVFHSLRSAPSGKTAAAERNTRPRAIFQPKYRSKSAAPRDLCLSGKSRQPRKSCPRRQRLRIQNLQQSTHEPSRHHSLAAAAGDLRRRPARGADRRLRIAADLRIRRARLDARPRRPDRVLARQVRDPDPARQVVRRERRAQAESRRVFVRSCTPWSRATANRSSPACGSGTKASIRDRVILVCRNATTDELQEPELATLKSHLTDAVQAELGSNAFADC